MRKVMAASDFTKKAIQEAFLELLNEKPIGKISIKDISDRCGINRNTFYYHYQDMVALLEEICSRDVDNIVKQYPELNSIEECMEALMEFAQANKRAAMHIFNSNNRNTYVSSLWKVCEHVVATYLQTVFPDIPVTEAEKALIIRYLKCSCFGLIVDWISTGMTDDYAQGLHDIIKSLRGVSDLIISNMQENR